MEPGGRAMKETRRRESVGVDAARRTRRETKNGRLHSNMVLLVMMIPSRLREGILRECRRVCVYDASKKRKEQK